MKKIIWSLLILLGIVAVAVSGCARWPDGPNGNGGTENYQLEITVEVAGEINPSEGNYYIVLDTDGNPATGPTEDISLWEGNYYYIRLDNMGCYLYPKEEGLEVAIPYYTFDNEKKVQVTIALSDLDEDPNSIDINVITTDSGNNTYDHLDSYFTIDTELYSIGEGISSTDLEEDKSDFDIVKVTAEITTY